MNYALLNRLTAQAGKRQQVVEILLKSGKLFDDNPACLLYLVSESRDDPDEIWVVDLWTDEEEHAEALKAPGCGPSWKRRCRYCKACRSKQRSDP
jgi:quinol monooxygenase YgiN